MTVSSQSRCAALQQQQQPPKAKKHNSSTDLVVDCGFGPICDFLFYVTSPMYYEREFYIYFELYLS